ncbi:hypothetical protein DMC25_09635 [Caulobacter sp. D4A]|uniref:hypothetical protein n=1 Tax=unclassified Caulobacter TaxID=2648921 RepID=UPI000D73B688|nr:MULTISPECIES: hypothetical protein [unclassified Caulobacter]PXA89396.1 hypothetical protein DMC25_09635 [Caulobacter sp. D4A]PXA95537.1 hypothetical protein DMC18_03845 [Caulobacter sp. D5]
MSDTKSKTPWHLWLVGAVAVLFNSVGVFDFVMSMSQGPAYMASAGMTQAQIDHYQRMPGWMTVVWAVGVFGAFGASVLILLRRKIAAPVFAVSLAAFLLSLVYTYVLSDGGKVMGQQMAVTSAVIAVLLALFLAYAWWQTRRGVLR